MSNEAPERVWLNGDALTIMDNTSTLTTIVSSIERKECSICYIRSDIAQAQTNAKVREVLKELKMSLNSLLSTTGYLNAKDAINAILNEYPDLLTNEEEMV